MGVRLDGIEAASQVEGLPDGAQKTTSGTRT